jgi:predicted transcriptional regulator
MARTTVPIEELKRLVREAGSQRAACALLGVSQAYVSDLLHGRRTFSDAVLLKMGLEKRETFTRVSR